MLFLEEISINFASGNFFNKLLYTRVSLALIIKSFFFFCSRSFTEISPFSLLKLIIHLWFFHSKSFKDNSLKKLLIYCTEKKEIKLKYELEKNVNLVSFEKNRIEISFNDNLDKNFIKDLSLKLFEWTNQRWIITLSKLRGEISIKEKEKIKKAEHLEKAKNSELYKKVLNKLPDASLVDVIPKNEKEK